MKQGDVSSMQTLQRSDAAYDVAKKFGLFATMEGLFQQDMEGELPNDKGYFSTTQELITHVFKGNREVHDRYTCACKVRMKEYILSSPTAWDNMMDATLHQAKLMTSTDSRLDVELGAWRHSAASLQRSIWRCYMKRWQKFCSSRVERQGSGRVKKLESMPSTLWRLN